MWTLNMYCVKQIVDKCGMIVYIALFLISFAEMVWSFVILNG